MYPQTKLTFRKLTSRILRRSSIVSTNQTYGQRSSIVSTNHTYGQCPDKVKHCIHKPNLRSGNLRPGSLEGQALYPQTKPTVKGSALYPQIKLTVKGPALYLQTKLTVKGPALYPQTKLTFSVMIMFSILSTNKTYVQCHDKVQHCIHKPNLWSVS